MVSIQILMNNTYNELNCLDHTIKIVDGDDTEQKPNNLKDEVLQFAKECVREKLPYPSSIYSPENLVNLSFRRGEKAVD